MAIIKTESISQANIKCRWEEPYVSEAINRLMSSQPRGVYRGFKVQEMSTPGSGVTITADTFDDSFLLHENIANGLKTAVRYDADVTLTFSFTVSADYYIWVDVDYTVSSATAGYIYIGEAADLAASPNAVVIAKFNSADGTITNSEITQDPTSSPVSFHTPVPDLSEKNYWGMLDQTRFDRIPTQNQKDAMTNANSPASGNPFLTVADAPTDIPFTYVVSDGVRSTGGDFDGPTALVDAIQALNTAGHGGTIFVRIGEYTLSATQSVSKPAKIICEVPSTNGSVGKRCALTMNHASGAGLYIESISHIYGLKTILGGVGTQALEYTEPFVLDTCDIEGTINVSSGGDFTEIRRCRFNEKVTFQASNAKITECSWHRTTAGFCLELNSVRRVEISKCYMDGCNKFPGPYVAGGGITTAAGSTIDGLVLEDIRIYCADHTEGVYLNSTGTVRGVKVRGLWITEVWEQGGTSTFEIGQSSDSSIIVEDVVIDKDHNQPIGANTFAWLPGDDLVNATARFSNIVLTGSDGYVTTSSGPNDGVATFQANGLCEDVHLIVENLSMSGFLPSIAGPNFGILVSAGIAWAKVGRHSTGITFERLNISNLNQNTLPSTGYMTGLMISNAGYLPGHVVIQNSTITGDGLDDSAGFTYWGVRVFEQSIDAPGQLVIRDSTITHWYTHDIVIYQCTVDLLIDGLASAGTAKNLSGTAGARIWMDESEIKLRVVNCLWSGGGGNDYYLFGGTAGGGAFVYPVVANNIINIGSGKYAIYFEDGAYKGMIFANGGQSEISVLDADNFLGVGATVPADNNTNQMTITLR